MKRLLGSLLIVVAAFATPPAEAQFPAAPAVGSNVPLDPIRCWWRTGAGAVRVGELFDLSLTCAVLDNDAVTVVPDESRLGADAVQFTPFEVVSGAHPDDLFSSGRRFFQYHYTLRIISPDAVDRDMALPSLAIHYTIKNRVSSTASVEGRDLVYILPTFNLRVSSMVPANATDIRDAPGADFAVADELTFRAAVLEMVATTCLVLAGLLIVIAVISLLRRGATRAPAGQRLLTTGQLARAARGELKAIARERMAQGWNDTLAARALAATRLAATCAAGMPPSQRLADSDTTAGEGRLLVGGRLRRHARVVSGSATAADMARAMSLAANARRAVTLEALREALTAFSASQYQRQPALDEPALDAALSSAEAATASVAREHAWWKTLWQPRRTDGPLPLASRA